MTAGNLRSAYGGESMAHVRYKIWGAKAREEGFANTGRLFEAISFAEQVHATNHFRELKEDVADHLVGSMAPFGLGATVENLKGAIDGETFEIQEMYPAYLETARSQKEGGAETSFHYALAAERVHAKLFEKARQSAAGNEDVKLGPVQICDRCGFTVEGDAPDVCPICKLGKEHFKTFA